MKRSAATITFLVFILSAYGQDNFLPGFIVKNSTDTIQGWIDYRNWDKGPLFISFKSKEDGENITYKPADISQFFVYGEYYVSATVNIDTVSQRINELPESSAPAYKKSLVFLQILFKGDKWLLHYKDQNTKSSFYIFNEGEYQLLYYKRFIADLPTKSIGENKIYLGLLASYLKDCSDIQSQLSKTPYTTNGLVNLFKHYYNCLNKPSGYIHERKDTKSEFGVTAGLTLSTVNFYNTVAVYNYLVESSFSTSTNAALGLYYDFSLLRTRGFKLSNDLMYTSFNVKSQSVIANATTNVSFDYSYLKGHSMLQYNILKNGSFYAGGGAALGLLLSHTTVANVVYNTGLVYDQDLPTTSIEYGFTVGMGTKIGKWKLESRYEKSIGVTQVTPSETQRIYFLLGYKLSK